MNKTNEFNLWESSPPPARRVQFTVRRMMIAVAVAALGVAGFQAGWQRLQARQQVHARIIIRQRLLGAIGKGNNAGMGRSGERARFTPVTAEEMKNDEDELRKAGELTREADDRIDRELFPPAGVPPSP